MGAVGEVQATMLDVHAFSKFKEHGFIRKMITWPRPRPFRAVFFLAQGGAIVDPISKFRECSFIHSRHIEGDLKFLKGLHDPTMPLSGDIFTPVVGLATVNPFAKFNQFQKYWTGV